MKIDVTNLKIGDRVACAYLMSYYQEHHGIKWMVEDRRPDDPRCIPFQKMWPWLCGEEDVGEVHFGNLWIKAPTVFEETGYEAKPPEVWTPLFKGLERKPFVIGFHCLTDAAYNTARNHDQRLWGEMLTKMKLAVPADLIGIDVIQSPNGSFDKDIAPRIAACDLFIGGDTGTSHLFAAIHPKRPCISIYPDMSFDQQAFEWERVKMGCSQPWNSLPLSFNRHVFTMKDHKWPVDEVVEKVKELIK